MTESIEGLEVDRPAKGLGALSIDLATSLTKTLGKRSQDLLARIRKAVVSRKGRIKSLKVSMSLTRTGMTES